MKRTLVLILSVVVAISMSACYSTHHGHGHRHKGGSKGMPPGQAKKNITENNQQRILPQDNRRKRNIKINIDLRDFSLLQKIWQSTKQGITKKSFQLINESSFLLFRMRYANGSLSAGGVEDEVGACELPNGSFGCEEPNGSWD